MKQTGFILFQYHVREREFSRASLPKIRKYHFVDQIFLPPSQQLCWEKDTSAREPYPGMLLCHRRKLTFGCFYVSLRSSMTSLSSTLLLFALATWMLRPLGALAKNFPHNDQPCNSDKIFNPFESRVKVLVTGQIPLSPQDVAVLEGKFTQAYNRLSCNSPKITTCKVINQDKYEAERYPSLLRLEFLITGVCHEYKHLFRSLPFEGGSKSGKKSSSKGKKRGSKSSTANNPCACDSPQQTRDDFAMVLQQETGRTAVMVRELDPPSPTITFANPTLVGTTSTWLTSDPTTTASLTSTSER